MNGFYEGTFITLTKESKASPRFTLGLVADPSLKVDVVTAETRPTRYYWAKVAKSLVDSDSTDSLVEDVTNELCWLFDIPNPETPVFKFNWHNGMMYMELGDVLGCIDFDEITEDAVSDFIEGCQSLRRYEKPKHFPLNVVFPLYFGQVMDAVRHAFPDDSFVHRMFEKAYKDALAVRESEKAGYAAVLDFLAQAEGYPKAQRVAHALSMYRLFVPAATEQQVKAKFFTFDV